MTPNSAYQLVEINKDQDYSPRMNNLPTINTGPVVSKGMSPPIFALWCIESCNSGSIKLLTLGNEKPVDIPCNALKPGVVYYIYLKKLIDDNDGKVKFLGYQYKEAPIQF